jgi:hypothetical protein
MHRTLRPVGKPEIERIEHYGAMQLAGLGVFGPTPDRAATIEVCRSRPVGRANHRDPVTPPHLPGSKPESSPPPGRKLPGGLQPKEDPP